MFVIFLTLVLFDLFIAGRRRRRQAERQRPEFDPKEVEEVRQLCERLDQHREGCLADLEAVGPEVTFWGLTICYLSENSCQLKY